MIIRAFYSESSIEVNSYRCLMAYSRKSKLLTMTMGHRIRFRREMLGWSQTDLAASSGISQQMISKLERGKARGTTEFVALARALGVSPTWLKYGEGPMEPAGEVIVDPDERQLIVDYRALQADTKPVALAAVHAMLPKSAGHDRTRSPPQGPASA